MKDRSRVSKALNATLGTGFLFARQSICCLTALTFCLQGSGILSEASARSTQKESSSSYARADKQKIARLPFGKKEEVDEENEKDSDNTETSEEEDDNDSESASDKKVEKKKKSDDDKELKSKEAKPKKEKKKKQKKSKEDKKNKSAAKDKEADEDTDEAEAKSEEKENLAREEKSKGSKSKEADDQHVDIQEVDVIEVEDEEGSKKKSESKPASEAEENAAEKASLEEPRLLPDSALISVLKDISKSLSELDANTGIDDPDEHKIVKLSKEILDKSLAADGVEADRILRPEHRAGAKSSMVVEAWSSGDVKLRENLRGSVAAVWGKRIDGIINVTIAGECKDLKAKDGTTIGKFIVIVSAKSPVKKGFDIQSQSDVTFWLGEVGKVDVDAAGLKKPEKKSEEGKDTDSTDQKKPEETGDAGDPVKKKSLVTLEPVLTDRKREYLTRYESYQNELEKIQQSKQQKLEQNRLEKERLIAEAEKLKQEKIEQEKARSRRAQRPDEVAYGFYPDDVEIIEIVEELEPTGKDKSKPGKTSQSVESDYDNIQAPEKKEKETVAHTRRKRTIRRVHRKSKEVEDEKESSTAQDESEVEEKKEKIAEKSPEAEDSKKADLEELDSDTDEKKSETEITDEKADADADAETEADKVAEVDADSETASNTRPKSDSESKSKEKKEPEQKQETSTTTAQKEPEQPSTPPAVETESESAKEERELKEKLASITKIAPIKPRTEEKETSSSPSPATASSRQWESPAVSYIMKQPSLGANLIYPERAIAGKFLTVAVLDKYGNPEPSVELSFNGATISTDAKGQAMFMVPEDATPGRTLHVSLAARPELSPGVIDVLQPLFSSTEANAPTIDNASKLVPNTKVLVIDGHDFMGMAGKNRVMIDNSSEAQVVASSPVQLKLKMPESLKPGSHKANIANSILRSNPVVFEFVKAAVIEGKKAKKKGDGDLIVKVEGTSKPVHVRLTNKTPEIIKISKGDELIVTTSGGTENTSRIEIKRLQKGDYRVDARIEM
ncbi:MAG: hypothetical protein R3F51_13040 [Cyanobacteriota/Melainabacteria group bacterium]